MAKIFYSTGIKETDVIVCASNVSTALKSAEIGGKYSTKKEFKRKSQELSF